MIDHRWNITILSHLPTRITWEKWGARSLRRTSPTILTANRNSRAHLSCTFIITNNLRNLQLYKIVVWNFEEVRKIVQLAFYFIKY